MDIAPTLAKLLGMPLIDGMDSTGRTSSERGAEPDVYLRRQDGKPIDEIIDGEARPDRAYIFLLDGLSNTELKERLEHDRESIPNLTRLIENGLMFRYGTIVNFPSITWPSHNALGTGAWCGHHDIVNPTYYLREKSETVTPQGMIWETGKYVTGDVETLYEAVHRVFGKWDGTHGEVTASINEPCMRGAGHATLERRMMIDTDKLRELTRANREDTNPRWQADGMEDARRHSMSDIQGAAQAMMLFSAENQPPPKFTYHEFSLTDAVGHDYGPHHQAVLDALVETDKRIGKILGVLDARGLFDSTLFVITTDHGMAPIDAERAADQTQSVIAAGLKAVCTPPLVYLLDMDVTIEPSPDGRTASVTVLANDADEHGERPPVDGAVVQVISHQGKPVAETKTDAFGACGLPRCPSAKTPRTSSSASSTSASTRATCAWTAPTSSRTSGSGCTARVARSCGILLRTMRDKLTSLNRRRRSIQPRRRPLVSRWTRTPCARFSVSKNRETTSSTTSGTMVYFTPPQWHVAIAF